jgi:cytochrome c2
LAVNLEDGLRRAFTVCHPSDASGQHGVGPNLRGVPGRKIASVPDYPFSEALRSLDSTWSPEQLDAFLANPLKRAPGTKMAFGGVASASDRAALIELLSKIP